MKGEVWKCPKCGAPHEYRYLLTDHTGSGPLVELCGTCPAIFWTEANQPRRLMELDDITRLGPYDRDEVLVALVRRNLV